MIWAVTGATGFLGRHLVEASLSRGATVRALSRTIVPPSVEHFEGDLLEPDPAGIAAFLKGADVLFHLAGMVSRQKADAEKMMRLHIEGTRAILEGAKKAGVRRVVLASTSGTVGIFEDERTADDNSPYAMAVASEFAYYRSKIYQEKLAMDFAKSSDLELVCLRPSLLLGPGDHRLSSTGDVKAFLDKKFPVIPAGGISFVDARDTAAAFVEAAVRKIAPLPRTYLLTAENWSMARFVREMEEVSGVRAPTKQLNKSILDIGSSIVKLLGEPSFLPDAESMKMASLYWYVDATRAKEELGFNTRPARETLRDTIDFIRAMP
ncbi:MAG TPA: NAD-dependent epimerase/dehydratase family protein [Leptospiraceae bacterium]|nr:NAD-dependent epimerase/dehydratase family protein [Leptospirales bacterium]HMU83781.1 NAD-dependent epimerase/dehydratase family protein [Leptospiraceae bacterium]HMX58438.1 NAD-dependent epimerase/dehydratase family protein [Leptospiraceae bacterium]HMY46588.1 NAD-dependent epimerase/dehydratase family protein [Leptospiraceae bacterium]HMZ37824.1 NAD-dependent epimerase/dehydratase family protein [Leptospiraceae bacterium]